MDKHILFEGKVHVCVRVSVCLYLCTIPYVYNFVKYCSYSTELEYQQLDRIFVLVVLQETMNLKVSGFQTNICDCKSNARLEDRLLLD